MLEVNTDIYNSMLLQDATGVIWMASWSLRIGMQDPVSHGRHVLGLFVLAAAVVTTSIQG